MRLLRPLTLTLAIIAPLAAQAQSDGNENLAARRLDRICNGDSGSRDSRMGEMMTQRLALNDQQKNLLKELGDARAKGRSDTKAALCTNRQPLTTFKDREAFWEALLSARLAALRTVRPKADAFYDALDQSQKAAFEEMIEKWSERRAARRKDEMRGGDRYTDDRSDYRRSDREGYKGREKYSDRDDGYRAHDDRYSDRYSGRERDYDGERAGRSRHWQDYRSYDRDHDRYGRDDRSRYNDAPRYRYDDDDND